MKKEIGIYIHIPFCKSKCYYCDFISFANKENNIQDYISAVIKEIGHIDLNKYIINTVYIGGGTPSILDSKYIIEIMDKLKNNLSENAEITIEVNPGTANRKKLEDYKRAGINRISIGLQSTEDYLLKEIGRIHRFEEFLNVFEESRDVGFQNINVDLMLGLPNQTLEILEKSVEKIVKLSPEHISIYSLILEEDTKLYSMINNKELKLPDEETERKMYWKVKEILEEKGYIHYEISNFSKEGYFSRHNSDCWSQKEYIGIGLAAHSYLENKRFSNIDDMEKYIKNINNNQFEQNMIIHENQTLEEKQKEMMLLGLRKIQGVNAKEFEKNFQKNPFVIYKEELTKLITEGLLEIKDDYIKLTNKGLDLANLVWEKFV